jgi:fimbrial chaperone protein
MGRALTSAAQQWLPGCARLAAAAALVILSGATAQAETSGLTIYPVTIQLAPGERAAVLTIENHTDTDTTFQIRAYSWSQPNGSDRLEPTDAVLVSPPLGTVAAGKSQVVRLVLRQPAQEREATYRVLFDQILGPPAPGSVNFALRLSIPVFAEPPTRVAPHVQWSVDHSSLVAVNDGGRHETFRDIAISTPDGRQLKLEQNVSPYVLAGSTHRWQILSAGFAASGTTPLRLKGNADSGAVDQAVSARASPP